MKKILMISILFLALGFQSNAQKSFKKGDVLLNPGVGLGSNYGVGFFGFRPSIFFSADIGVHDYVSVGPYIGSTFFRNATGVDFGARGNFHWWQLLDDKVNADLKQSQLDLYATLWMGGELILTSFGNAGSFDIGFTQGVRWYPKANKFVALYGEVGYTPISFATIGATFKISKKD